VRDAKLSVSKAVESKATVERDGQRAEVYDAVAEAGPELAEAVNSKPQLGDSFDRVGPDIR